MATTTTDTLKEANPGKTLKQQQEPSDPPHPTESPNGNTSSDAEALLKDGVGGDEELKVTTGDPTDNNNNNNSSSATDTQKRIRRAERFGMPVQLSEQEKRNSRAERFGTGSGLQGSDAIKKSEEHKRKARAERFGLEQSVPAAEEETEKKKARVARFAPVMKTDSVEEDKMKARALRFSETSSSLPQANGKGIEPKAAITGKAGGGA